jgi:hypothetical protein
MLAEGGHFGFLTSSSWLDVEYGFLLQKWILENFKLVAVMESDAEPWFEDARVKTCATILQRCADANERMNTSVKFVKFKRPLAQIIGVAPERAELRFPAVDSLRDRIESTRSRFRGPANAHHREAPKRFVGGGRSRAQSACEEQCQRTDA